MEGWTSLPRRIYVDWDKKIEVRRMAIRWWEKVIKTTGGMVRMPRPIISVIGRGFTVLEGLIDMQKSQMQKKAVEGE